MPLWDSVQRGLEKASQEAARIAKTQRLRATIDGLTRQINLQNNTLIDKAMELFTTGQLFQSELLPICQELANLKQQLNDAQIELKLIQTSQPPAAASQPEGPVTYPPTMPAGSMPFTPPLEGSGELLPTVYAPPPPGYHPYLDSTGGDTTVPPPPPGLESLTISSMETVIMDTGAPTSLPTSAAPESEKQTCPACRAEIQPGHAFCHNCGMPVQNSDALHLPTVRANPADLAFSDDQGTVRANTGGPAYVGGDETVREDMPPLEQKPGS